MFPAVVMVATVGDDAGRARRAGTAWLSALYNLPPAAFERRLVAGPADQCAEAAARYVAAGAEHVIVMVAADVALDQFGSIAAEYRRLPAPASRSSTSSRIRAPDMAGVGS